MLSATVRSPTVEIVQATAERSDRELVDANLEIVY